MRVLMTVLQVLCTWCPAPDQSIWWKLPLWKLWFGTGGGEWQACSCRAWRWRWWRQCAQTAAWETQRALGENRCTGIMLFISLSCLFHFWKGCILGRTIGYSFSVWCIHQLRLTRVPCLSTFQHLSWSLLVYLTDSCYIWSPLQGSFVITCDVQPEIWLNLVVPNRNSYSRCMCNCSA